MLDYAVLPGQFQPPHNDHLRLIHDALALAERVIVVCGGVDLSRSIQRPWSGPERIKMLYAMLPRTIADRVSVVGMHDTPYRPARQAVALKACVATEIERRGRGPASATTGVYVSGSDALPVVGELSALWQLLPYELNPGYDATSLRARYFAAHDAGAAAMAFAGRLPDAVCEFLESFRVSTAFNDLRAEFAANETFRSRWSGAPWPPVFVTVDAVVTASRRVLLIRRGRYPGRGLWALPGGFLDPDETLRDACLRELQEETSITCDRARLIEAIREVEVFDHPYRSARGRTVTHAYRFDLHGAPPAVHGGDDAAAARWVSTADLQRHELFEDHYAILQAMLGVE